VVKERNVDSRSRLRRGSPLCDGSSVDWSPHVAIQDDAAIDWAVLDFTVAPPAMRPPIGRGSVANAPSKSARAPIKTSASWLSGKQRTVQATTPPRWSREQGKPCPTLMHLPFLEP